MAFDPNAKMAVGVKTQEEWQRLVLHGTVTDETEPPENPYLPAAYADLLNVQRDANKLSRAWVQEYRCEFIDRDADEGKLDLLKMAAPGRKFGRAVQMSVKAGDRFAETMRETSEAVAALGQAFDGISQIIGVDYGESHSVAIIGDTAPDGSVTITHEVWDADRGYIEALQKCCDFDDRILYALAEKGNDANERKACRFLMTARLEAKAARARNVVMRDDFDNLPDAEPRGIVPRPR